MRSLLCLLVTLCSLAFLDRKLEASDYAIGADLSFLKQAEDGGTIFKDGGLPRPGLQIFKDHGYNWVRLRLFHTPTSLPNNLDYTIALAQDARRLGFKFLLDFHYSDTWADPGKQYTPAAWKGKTHDQLVQAVFEYTRDAIHAFRAAGVLPDMVQIGNEVIAGMLWPDGKLPDHWDHFAELVKAGIKGVDAGRGDGPRPRIMIHIDRGGDREGTKAFFDRLHSLGVDYDVIGQSYYPWWHGNLLALRKNLDFMATTYRKDIILVEVAYGWRPAEYTRKPGPFPETAEGQKEFLDEVNRLALDTPDHRCIGVFWWEPAVSGGLRSRGFFDDDGNALPVIHVFDRFTRMPLPLQVVGARVVNSRNEPVRLRGVNTAGLEWSSNGEGHILSTVNTAIRDWHVNVIRVPLAQDRWFGKAPEQQDEGKAYRALVNQVVDRCAAEGRYVILDLHWSDADEWGKQIGQHVMPDRNSLKFWKDLAGTYKNHPAVIFDLYNEPHDVNWDVWQRGGQVTEKASRRNPARTYEAVGMQTLLDAVRETGARNVVIAGGLDWAYDMSGFLKGRQLADPKGNGVIYANHAYPFKGDTVEKWVAKMEAATRTLPVIVSEFGSDSRIPARDEQWVRRVLQILEDHGWNWTAWDLHPFAGPRLISDWNYTPTPSFGKWVKLTLEGALPRYDPAAATPDPPKAATTLPRRDSGPVGQFEGHADIGKVRHGGQATLDTAAKVYTVSGSGENMWSGKDAFHFAWRQASGDLALSVDVAFLGKGTDPHRKACLMFRQSLDADSAYVDVALHGDGLTSLQFRAERGAATHEVRASIRAPRRLRIEKRGKYSVMYLGQEGEELKYSGAAVRISLQDPFYVGIGVCSHNEDVTESAVFSKVELTSPLPVSPGRPILYSTLEIQSMASTDRRVVHVAPTRFEAPNWLQDGKSLIFNSAGRIYRIPAAGGQAEVIDTGFATRCNNDHGISPDGTLLAISDQSQARGKSLIYTLPVAGGTPRQITSTGPSYWHGWSPDGKTLAFCGERQGEFDIYTVPVAGGVESRLTNAAGLDDGPEYSPDGKAIYFNSVRTGTMQIWRMRTDGSEQEQVTSDEFNNWFPHLSPDGRFMVFLSYEKEVTGHPEDQDVTLRRMNLASKQIDVLARLFGGQGTINVPCWSPDGRQIAFVSYQFIPEARAHPAPRP